jgi:hypothetical protein
MHCRTCGKEADPAAAVCPNCGCPPNAGSAFCPHCGVGTQANQIVCVSCGMSLGTGKPPGKVQAIATFGITCLFCFAPIYSLIIGIIAIVKGAKLLGRQAQSESPPTTMAVLQIVNIICCDWLNLVAGIIELVFLSDPEVKAYYAT